MKYTREIVLSLNRYHPAPDVLAEKLTAAADEFGVVGRPARAMLIAQLMHESSGVPVSENLNYSAARLMQVWPSRFPTVASAQAVAYNPRALAERVYGGRGGNGPAGSGEGFAFRGRGLIQLTFRDNYALYGRLAGFDLVSNPDLLLQYGVGCKVAGAYWARCGAQGPAERGDVRAVTRLINGGLNGLDDRERLYQRAVRRAFGVLGGPAAALDPAADAEADEGARLSVFERALSLLGGAS